VLESIVKLILAQGNIFKPQNIICE